MPTRQSRGTVRPSRAEEKRDNRMTAALELVGDSKPANIRDSIAVSRPEYWARIGETVAEGAMLASDIVIRQLRLIHTADVPEIPKGLKDITTIAAILIDKGHVIEQTLAAIDPNRTPLGLSDLEKRIALLLAAQVEYARRAEPVDVTPGAPPK